MPRGCPRAVAPTAESLGELGESRGFHLHISVSRLGGGGRDLHLANPQSAQCTRPQERSITWTGPEVAGEELLAGDGGGDTAC